eukprot:12371753-Ditylum_brightwellii.AAC.1
MEKEYDSKSSRGKPKSTKEQVSSSAGNYNVLNNGTVPSRCIWTVCCQSIGKSIKASTRRSYL